MENPILQGDGDTKWARKDKRTREGNNGRALRD